MRFKLKSGVGNGPSGEVGRQDRPGRVADDAIAAAMRPSLDWIERQMTDQDVRV